MTANPCPFKIAMSKKALLSHLPGYYKGRMGTGLLIFESTEYMLIIFAYRNSEFTVFDPADLRYGCVLWFGGQVQQEEEKALGASTSLVYYM